MLKLISDEHAWLTIGQQFRSDAAWGEGIICHQRHRTPTSRTRVRPVQAVEQMAELFVMCSTCGVRGTLAHSRQDLLDPEGKCKQGRPPAKCAHLRDVLAAAHRTLDLLEWHAKREAFSRSDRERPEPPASGPHQRAD
jgi:hypothetical protein